MIIEYCFYDISYSDEEIKNTFKQVKTYEPSMVSVFPYNLRIAKNIFDNGIKINCVIDYPFGMSDIKVRTLKIQQAKKMGANCVSLVAPPSMLTNRKYDKFREDIRNSVSLCKDLDLEVRYILEYRVFTYNLLYKIAQILHVEGVSTIYPATGYGLDDINDNILACILINKKVPINIVCNGNVWNKNQISNINKAKLYGLQLNSLNSIKLMYENQLK